MDNQNAPLDPLYLGFKTSSREVALEIVGALLDRRANFNADIKWRDGLYSISAAEAVEPTT